jgi:hypothetical protein
MCVCVFACTRWREQNRDKDRVGVKEKRKGMPFRNLGREETVVVGGREKRATGASRLAAKGGKEGTVVHGGERNQA